MLSYRDKTWCPFYKSCYYGESCHDALTPTIYAQAVKWWGNPKEVPPIYSHREKPECWEEK